MPDGTSEIADRLARLSHTFSARSRSDAARLAELQRALVSCDSNSAAATVREIEAIAHRLHGTAGTLGFAAISEAAAAVEEAVSVFGGQGVPAEPNAFTTLAATIDQLLSVINRLPTD
jgi:chemotaxis protein histidine kinase CheA